MENQENIWVGFAGNKLGPFTKAAVRARMAAGEFPPNAMGWTTGMPGWVLLSTLFPVETTADSDHVGQVPPPPFAAAAPAAAASVGDAAALPGKVNLSTWQFVLLTFVTAGLYPMLWLYRNNRLIDEIAGQKTTSDAVALWLLGLTGFHMLIAGQNVTALDVVAALMAIAVGVIWIVWAFKAKRALEHYALNELRIYLRMNGFYTFLFTVYYINYCINDLPEAKARHGVMLGTVARD